MHDAITLSDMFGMIFFTIVVCAVAGTISGFLAYEAGYYTGYVDAIIDTDDKNEDGQNQN